MIRKKSVMEWQASDILRSGRLSSPVLPRSFLSEYASIHMEPGAFLSPLNVVSSSSSSSGDNESGSERVYTIIPMEGKWNREEWADGRTDGWTEGCMDDDTFSESDASERLGWKWKCIA